jgi:hypothetical protein
LILPAYKNLPFLSHPPVSLQRGISFLTNISNNGATPAGATALLCIYKNQFTIK